jgi:beta-glucosidase-like glycosyl hydrolase
MAEKISRDETLNQEELFDYKNSQLPIDKRVADLLKHMSLEEKVAQLMGLWNGGVEDFSDEVLNDPLKMRETFGKGCNSIHPAALGVKETVEVRNKIQKYLIEETLLGIPVLFVDEGQHGIMRPDSTVFPQAIGLACSWDTLLFEEIYNVIALEMRSRGTHVALSPVIDICREPRWGRVEETYGEDPYLSGVLGCAAVKGFQGSTNGSIDERHVAATLKHLVGHGQPEGGQNQGPANYSMRVLLDFHILPFKMCIDNVKPIAVMPSYNEIDGIPSHANKWLIKDLLRTELGFKGIVVADYYAIDQLFLKEYVAEDAKDAARIAFNTGVQFEFPQANLYKFLPELLEEDQIKQEDIDTAVAQALKLKFELGLFENPYIDAENAENVSKNPEHKELALIAARESIVLLKNDNLLPIPKDKYKKIAVIGPCARDLFFGGYSGEPFEKVSILEGITKKVGNNAEVVFAQGCKLTTNTSTSFLNWKCDEIKFASREENLELIKEAVIVAEEADLIILAIGENDHLCREAWSKSHIGDNMTLDLFGEQNELVDSLVQLGKPIVAYLMNGRPLSVNNLVEKIPAVIEGWYMGQETGTAAADIIFGDVNPSGKLAITIPKSVGQLPIYYNHKPGAQFLNYISQDINPLFHFGFGLSYTSFEFSKPLLEKNNININESTKVSVDVKNTGRLTGDEVVQMYIRDKVSSVTRPVKELKGFQRISLKPGETKTVTLEITPDKLAFHNIDMEFVVEPGEFEIMVGNSSRAEDLSKIILKVV